MKSTGLFSEYRISFFVTVTGRLLDHEAGRHSDAMLEVVVALHAAQRYARAAYRLNRTSPTTVRRRMSPKMCCWMLWLNRFVTLTSVVIAPSLHFIPKLPFTIV